MSQKQRQQLLSILSRSPLALIKQCWQGLDITPDYQELKAPESGMVMVKAKAGGAGQPFNMGEMTVTRSVVKLNTGEVGYGYTQGREKAKSELIAVIDACHQVEQWRDKIQQELIQPLDAVLQKQYEAMQEKTDASKVNFFTMVRGS